MSPAFERGDILFLKMPNDRHVTAGDIVVFNVRGREVPIVHRLMKTHEKR